jgi:chromosome segregation ATPase
MTEEIKEIFKTKLYFDLDETDYIKIQNYITNLQKENENLKNNYNDNEQAIHKIMEENKHLRTELNCYKLKCEKASDFILSKAKEYKPHFAKVELNTADCNELLNILQGGDE